MTTTTWRRLLTFAAVSLFATAALAVPIETTRFETTSTYGTKIDGLALTSGRYTGWIDTGVVRAVIFDIDFTDANSSCTAVKMVCETSQVATTTNGAGRDYHGPTTCSGGSCFSEPKTWCDGTNAACGVGAGSAPGSSAWTWVVDNVPGPWLNCYFTATGTPAAADVLTVYARGVSP